MSHIQKKIFICLFHLVLHEKKKIHNMYLPYDEFCIQEKSNLVSWQLGLIFKRQKSNIVHKYFRLVKRLNPEIFIFYIYHVQEI
jgi:hypothetical protein